MEISCWDEVASLLHEEVALDVESLREEIVRAYSSSGRHYHTLQHILYCLRVFSGFANRTPPSREIAAALLFHDAAYVPGALDNEAKSADFACNLLRKLPDHGLSLDLVASLVHSTAREPSTVLESLVHDVDYSVFAAPHETYAAYASGIRAEYEQPCLVQGLDYNKERASFLRRLQNGVFCGSLSNLEPAAQENIRWELAELWRLST